MRVRAWRNATVGELLGAVEALRRVDTYVPESVRQLIALETAAVRAELARRRQHGNRG